MRIVDEMLRISHKITKFSWRVMMSEADSSCQHWYRDIPESPERFTGPWDQTLKNPILVLSNMMRRHSAGAVQADNAKYCSLFRLTRLPPYQMRRWWKTGWENRLYSFRKTLLGEPFAKSHSIITYPSRMARNCFFRVALYYKNSQVIFWQWIIAIRGYLLSG